MSATNYTENAIGNAILRNTTYTSPATVYAALSTSATDEAGAITEPSGNGYARQAVTFGAPGTPGEFRNSATVSFTASGGNFGTVTHFAVYDAATSGNMLFQAALDAPRVINDATTASFGVGELDVTLS